MPNHICTDPEFVDKMNGKEETTEEEDAEFFRHVDRCPYCTEDWRNRMDQLDAFLVLHKHKKNDSTTS